MGSGSSVEKKSESHRFLHQFDEIGYDFGDMSLDVGKPNYHTMRLLTSQTSSASLPHVNDGEPQQGEDETLIENFKQVDSAVRYEDFFFKVRSNTISIDEAKQYIEDFPDALFSTDCCGSSPVDYAHKNKNKELCVFLIHSKFTIAKLRVLNC